MLNHKSTLEEQKKKVIGLLSGLFTTMFYQKITNVFEQQSLGHKFTHNTIPLL